jgi:hypothetical protein
MTVGIRVGDVNSPKWLPPNHARRFRVRSVERLEQRVVLVSVPMRPTVDRDCYDVTRGIKSAIAEHSAELVAYVAFEDIKFGGEEFPTPRPILILTG